MRTLNVFGKKFSLKIAKVFLIGSMYRHPNETVQWNEIFDNQFEKILACEKEIYLMGDFNRDLLQVNTKKTWLEYMESFGLEHIVMSPTRITDHSETLIDHIYRNSLSNVL